jgi:hypothetical protein
VYSVLVRGCRFYATNASSGDLIRKLKSFGIYTHTNPEEERKAAVAVERAIYGDQFPNLFPTGNNSSVAAVTLN